MHGQSGKCNQGTFDLSKLFLDRTFPLNKYYLFIHVKTEKRWCSLERKMSSYSWKKRDYANTFKHVLKE